MNIEKLREELKVDEGCINEIYLDHLGYHTFGIGHLITNEDKEWGEPVGTPISTKRVNECFKNDIEIVYQFVDKEREQMLAVDGEQKRLLQVKSNNYICK